MRPRPMSPHLGVYKFTYTMSLSILHRITGVALTFGFLLFVAWLMALSTGPDAYARVMGLLNSVLGRIALGGFAFAFIYHLCNGIRHLIWDAGIGLERSQARRSGAVVIVVALVLTAVVIWFGCRAFGLSAGVAP